MLQFGLDNINKSVAMAKKSLSLSSLPNGNNLNGPSTPVVSSTEFTHFMNKVLSRFDRLDEAIVDNKRQIEDVSKQMVSINTEVRHLNDLQKRSNKENRSMAQKYGKDAFKYLDILCLISANRLNVPQSGNSKEVLIKSLFSQVYASLGQHMNENETNEDFADTASMVEDALDTFTENLVNFYPENGFDAVLQRFPKTTLHRSSVSKQEEGGQSSNNSAGDDNNNPISNDDQFVTCDNAETSNSDDADKTLVAATNRPVNGPSSSPHSSLNQQSSPSSPNTSNDFLSSSLLSFSSPHSSTTNRTDRRDCRILNPIEMTTNISAINGSVHLSSIPDDFPAYTTSTPAIGRMSKSDAIFYQMLAQNRARRASRRASTQPNSPVRSKGFLPQPHTGTVSRLSTDSLKPSVNSASSSDGSLETTVIPRQPATISTEKPSVLAKASKKKDTPKKVQKSNKQQNKQKEDEASAVKSTPTTSGTKRKPKKGKQAAAQVKDDIPNVSSLVDQTIDAVISAARSNDPFEFDSLDGESDKVFPLLNSSKKTATRSAQPQKLPTSTPSKSARAQLQSTVNENLTTTDFSHFVTANTSTIRQDSTLNESKQPNRNLRPRNLNLSYKALNDGKGLSSLKGKKK